MKTKPKKKQNFTKKTPKCTQTDAMKRDILCLHQAWKSTNVCKFLCLCVCMCIFFVLSFLLLLAYTNTPLKMETLLFESNKQQFKKKKKCFVFIFLFVCLFVCVPFGFRPPNTVHATLCSFFWVPVFVLQKGNKNTKQKHKTKKKHR